MRTIRGGVAYEDDALAEVIDRGGAQDIAPLLEAPIVVIGWHALEREVADSAGK